MMCLICVDRQSLIEWMKEIVPKTLAQTRLTKNGFIVMQDSKIKLLLPNHASFQSTFERNSYLLIGLKARWCCCSIDLLQALTFIEKSSFLRSRQKRNKRCKN